jgi:hypothetical protein
MERAVYYPAVITANQNAIAVSTGQAAQQVAAALLRVGLQFAC